MTTNAPFFALWLALLGLSTSGCSAEVSFSDPLPWLSFTQEVSSTCIPHFASQGVWRAADGGRSIALPNGASVHLFGDTVLAADEERAPTMVGNSIGVAACDGPDFVIQYHWRRDREAPRAFFDMGDPSFRLWPSDGFYADGRLYVVLTKIAEIDSGFGFGYAGTVLATVDDPEAPPPDWRIGYATLSNADAFWPTKGVTVDEDYAYVYAELHAPGGDEGYPSPTGLGRLDLDHLDTPEASLEVLSVDGSWKPAATVRYDDVFVVADDASMNMHVHDHSGLGKWVTVQADASLAPRAVIRTADALAGPWSAPKTAFEFPEMAADPTRVVCYAVTEHTQYRLDDGDTLVITYACNTPGVLAPLDDLDLYLPKTVLLNLRSRTAS